MSRPLHFRRQTGSTRSAARGFTLLEVLIALLVLSIGLLGLGAMQMTSLKNNHSAYLRSQATFLAYDVLDRMRANRPTATTTANYATALAAAGSEPTNCITNTCDGSEMAAFDIWEWKTEVAARLPGGLASVAAVATPTTRWTVTVQWVDQAEKDTGDADADVKTSQVAIFTEI